MIYDLKAEGRDLTTHANPICRGSPQRHRDRRGAFGLLERHDLDFIPRGLRVWVPKRMIPRLGALSVVSIRAKRTQFLASRAAGGQSIMQNEPNSPAGREPRERATGGAACTNKPNLGRPPGRPGPGGRNGQNEPNLAGRAGPQRAKCAKQSQKAGVGRQLYKQSQFCQSDAKGQVLCRKRLMVNWTGRGPWRNKANSRSYGKGRGLRAAVVQTNPISATRGGRRPGVLYKQTQFQAVGRLDPGPVVPNKAKLGRTGACGQRHSS
jgi:hypothetical protein